MAINQTKIAGGELHGLSKSLQKLMLNLVNNSNEAASTTDVANAIKNMPSGTASNDLFWRGDSSWAKPNLDNQSNSLDSDVALTLADTYYDGPTLDLPSGIWHVTGSVFISGLGTNCGQAKLYDLTNAYASGEGPGGRCSIFLNAIIALSEQTVIKLAAAANATGATLKAALSDNPVGNNATYLMAVRIGD
jgi:hypothetical protein